MARTRVDELAGALGVDSRKVLDILTNMGSPAKDHSAILSEREARVVRDAITREALARQRGALPSAAPGATVQRAKPVQAPPVVKARVVAPPESAPPTPPAAKPAVRPAAGPAAPAGVRARPAPPPEPAATAAPVLPPPPVATDPAPPVPKAGDGAGGAPPAAAPAQSAAATAVPAGRAAPAIATPVAAAPAPGAAAPGPSTAPNAMAPAARPPSRPQPRSGPAAPGGPAAAGAPLRPGGGRPDQRPRPGPRPGPGSAPPGAPPRPGAGGMAPRPGGAPPRPGARPPGPGGARPGAGPGGRPGGPAGRPGGGGRPGARPGRTGAGADRAAATSRPSRGPRRGPPSAELVEARRPRAARIALEGPLSLRDLAERIGVSAADAIKQLMSMGVMATLNQTLDLAVSRRLAAEFGVQVESPPVDSKEAAETVAKTAERQDRGSKFLRVRPPVITVMGHVDHGKTTLLDAIRRTNVVANEAGGITQHIGASVVNWRDNRLVFIDTPGHEAFTAMRARGAQVTDLVVLVVAADDGVKPQTIEAISHIRAAKVPMIVAVNKVDRPGADVERVKRQLSDQGVVAEDWGGDTVFVSVSALRGQGIDTLLEMIVLSSEMLELRANPLRAAKGTVIEAKLDRGRGPVATVLVQTGTLRIGEVIVSGSIAGRVRALFDDRGERLESAGPSQPVEVLGLPEVPPAGEGFEVVEDEKTARELVAKAGEDRRTEAGVLGMLSLEDLYQKVKAGTIKDLNLVVKADVQGSLEALQSSLLALTLEEVKLQVLHGGVGPITETDVMLAATSGAIIIGFNVRPDTNARRIAAREQVDVRTYQIIYEVLDDITAAAKGLLAPKMRKVLAGRAQVRQTFSVPRVGVVAGCQVVEGRVTRNSEVRVVRGTKVLHEGKISSLKRFRDDVREVQTGFECGIGVEGWEQFEAGDVIEAYVIERVEAPA